MDRPFRCSCVRCMPGTNYFKPRGVPLTTLEEVNLTVDEFEAYRVVGGTVKETIEKWKDSSFEEITVENACSEHRCH